MIRIFLISLLITCGSLCSLAEDRGFLHYYETIDSLLAKDAYGDVNLLFQELKKQKSTYSTNDKCWFKLIHARILQHTESEKDAGVLLFKNLKDVENTNDTSLMLYQYLLIGDLSNAHGEEYLHKANKLCRPNDLKFKSKIYYHFAKSYCESSDTIDSFCIEIYQKALDFSKAVGDQTAIANIYNNMSSLYEIRYAKIPSRKDLDLSILYIDSSIQILKTLKDSSSLAIGLLNKAAFYSYIDASKYLSFLKEAEKMNNDTTAYEFYSALYFNLADASERLGNYDRALEYMYEYSYFNDEKLARFEEKDLLMSVADYEYNQLENEVKIAESLALIKAKEASALKWFIGLGLLVFALIVGVLIKNFRLKRQNLELEINQNKLLAEQKVQEINSQNKSEVLHASLDAREEERKSISEVLHNSVSAILSSANLHLTVLNKKTNIDSKQEYVKTKQLLMEASDKVRDISHELVSPALQKFGLQAAISDLCEKYSNEFLLLECDVVDLNPRPSLRMETKVFRIIEELINNIIKHSEASRAFITLEKNTYYLNAEIKDNGKGISMEQFQNTKSLGLQQVSLIVSFYGGSFSISGEDGTVVKFNIPTNVLYQQAEL